MTRKNSQSTNSPFLLKPAEKDYLWGGERLKNEFCKVTRTTPLAETWECSTHPDGVSTVASGVFLGESLQDVLKLHPEILGSHVHSDEGIPIIVKFIDAKEDLSIQVHPDDEYAYENENGQKGKSELWYVVDAQKGAKIIYGLHHTQTKDKIRQSLYEGNFDKYTQKINVQKNDVYYIAPGTIHAIGAGVLVAEIQQKSNLTYRMYDYNRKDKTGHQRELHIEKALDVANLNASPEPLQPMRVLKYRLGCADELLCRCKYFQVERMIINTERIKEMVDYFTDSLSFHILLCVQGCGMIMWDDGSLPFFKGDCVFIPANSAKLKIHGKAQFLNISC